jgi:hypothetical protein
MKTKSIILSERTEGKYVLYLFFYEKRDIRIYSEINTKIIGLNIHHKVVSAGEKTDIEGFQQNEWWKKIYDHMGEYNYFILSFEKS